MRLSGTRLWIVLVALGYIIGAVGGFDTDPSRGVVTLRDWLQLAGVIVALVVAGIAVTGVDRKLFDFLVHEESKEPYKSPWHL